MDARPNIVLVHGAWADGSSWSSVIQSLQREGLNVTAPQFSMAALADDVARLRHEIENGVRMAQSLGLDVSDVQLPRLAA